MYRPATEATLLMQRRLLISAALAYAAFRNRAPILARIRAIAAAIRRTAHAADVASLVVSQTSADILHYLQPSLTPRPLPPRPAHHATRTPPPSVRGCTPHSSPSSSVTATPVPKSVRRLLRLAASPEGLVILRNLAGGVAQGVARQLTPAAASQRAGTSAASNAPSGEERLRAALDALASPQGMHVATNLVATGVREAMRSVLEFQHAHRREDEKPLPELIMDGVLSDRGRRLIVELVTSVTRTVVPIVLTHNAAADPVAAQEDAAVPSNTTLSPVVSPLRRKRPAAHAPAKMGTPGSVLESPSKQIMLSMMRAQGGSGIIERLALLAIRDKGLVRDVVRTVVSEAVRTYLTTQAELQAERDQEGSRSRKSRDDDGDGVAEDATGTDESSQGTVKENSVVRTSDATTIGRGRGEGETGKPLWKLLIMSVVTDLKQAMIRRGSEPTSTGWVVF